MKQEFRVLFDPKVLSSSSPTLCSQALPVISEDVLFLLLDKFEWQY